MNRRSFLASLLATATLDPERLLWTPGRKLISIPKPTPGIWFRKDAFSMVSIPMEFKPKYFAVDFDFTEEDLKSAVEATNRIPLIPFHLDAKGYWEFDKISIKEFERRYPR